MPTQSTWHMYRAFAGTGLVCAVLIVVIFQFTAPIITANKTAALNRAVLLVLSEATYKQAFELNDAGLFEPTAETRIATNVVYVGYKANGELAGIAIPAQGMGYQDNIELLYGYSLSKKAVVGLNILSSRETPGLGSKIADDEAFQANFKHLTIAVSSASLGAETVEVVKATQRRESWQINAISGATVSSKAVANILSESISYWLPKILRQQDVFERYEKNRD
ncbi:FMN-binding protein [Pseudomonadota bacterium]